MAVVVPGDDAALADLDRPVAQVVHDAGLAVVGVEVDEVERAVGEVRGAACRVVADQLEALAEGREAFSDTVREPVEHRLGQVHRVVVAGHVPVAVDAGQLVDPAALKDRAGVPAEGDADLDAAAQPEPVYERGERAVAGGPRALVLADQLVDLWVLGVHRLGPVTRRG